MKRGSAGFPLGVRKNELGSATKASPTRQVANLFRMATGFDFIVRRGPTCDPAGTNALSGRGPCQLAPPVLRCLGRRPVAVRAAIRADDPKARLIGMLKRRTGIGILPRPPAAPVGPETVPIRNGSERPCPRWMRWRVPARSRSHAGREDLDGSLRGPGRKGFDMPAPQTNRASVKPSAVGGNRLAR